MFPISIGIPFYNGEAYLADAIRSVFVQTHQDWELILVNDGSTDRSLDIAMSVRDPRVRVISDGQNRRLPYRLNQITAEAKHDFIARMDADDLMSPQRCERQLGVLRSDPGVDLVTAGICSITNDNRPVGVRGGTSDGPITGRGLLLGRVAVVHAAIMGRRAWFLRNPYDGSVDRTEDYELWLRAFARKDFKLHIMNEALYYYREEQNVTAGRQLTAYASQRALYRKYGHLGFAPYEVLVNVVRSYGKSMIVRALSTVDRMDILLDRRNQHIDDPLKMAAFVRELNEVLATKVPGLD